MPADLAAAIETSAAILRQRLGARAPKVAVLLGSGWGPFAQQVQDALDVPYADLPAFPQLAIGGHVRPGEKGAQARSRAAAVHPA